MIQVKNITGNAGNAVKNQFIVEATREEAGSIYPAIYFQSYETIIACKCNGKVYLDRNAWDYNRTTGKYRNIFLGETKAETERKIASSEYILTDLNA